MKRILTIDKCQDCNIETCSLRTMCGLIPDECPLQKESEVNVKPSWDDAPDFANWLTCDDDGWYWWEDEPCVFEGIYLAECDSMAPKPAGFPIPVNYTMAIYSRPESHKEEKE